MKKYVFTAACLFGLLGVSLAQSAPAKSAFAKLHPQATGVKWEKEAGDFEASFTENGKATSVVMDSRGTLKETEIAVAVSELPAAIRAYVAKQMPGKKIREAALITDASGAKKYEAEVGGKDLFFGMDGKPLK